MGALGSEVFGWVSGGFAGISEQWGYNNRLELTSIQASSANGTAISLAYCFTTFSFSAGCSSTSTSNNGRLTGITNGVNANESLAFTHDLLNRIATAATRGTTGSDCWGQSFTQDAVAT